MLIFLKRLRFLVLFLGYYVRSWKMSKLKMCGPHDVISQNNDKTSSLSCLTFNIDGHHLAQLHTFFDYLHKRIQTSCNPSSHLLIAYKILHTYTHRIGLLGLLDSVHPNMRCHFVEERFKVRANEPKFRLDVVVNVQVRNAECIPFFPRELQLDGQIFCQC